MIFWSTTITKQQRGRGGEKWKWTCSKMERDNIFLAENGELGGLGKWKTR